jgi:diaminopimelate decarboxylase
MDLFQYRNAVLHCEDVAVPAIVEEVGTPVYIYSANTILDHYRKIDEAFQGVDHSICFSVKACSNLAVLSLLRRAGSGFDVVSGGELFRAQRAGADPSTCVYAGVGKTAEEIKYALSSGIRMLNVESEPELASVNRIASEMSAVAPVALRLNPDVDARTHAAVSTGRKENKFGIGLAEAAAIMARRAEYPSVLLRGVHGHIGSQMTRIEPYVEACGRLVDFILAHRSEKAPLDHLNLGGGFGINYEGGEARPVSEFAEAVKPLLVKAGCKLILEPGRFIAGNAGILVTRVVYVKETREKRFLIIDAGMNDLIRPALYGAYHEIWPVASPQPPAGRGGPAAGRLRPADLVGPVCESDDTFANDRPFPEAAEGELIAVFGAGAYGHVMSSTYNARRRPPEVLVRDASSWVVRRRDTFDDLIAQESIPPEL